MSFQCARQVRKTRRRRPCAWCWDPIEAGEPSVVLSGVFQNDFFCNRYHPECHDAIARYCDKYSAWGEEFPLGPMARGGTEQYESPDEPVLDTATNIQ